MASSNKGKKKIVKKVVKRKSSLRKEINDLKEEHDKALDQIVSSTVYKKDIQNDIDQNNIKCKKSRQFLRTLEITVATEKTKISEFEGAILALTELLTSEKVE